MNQDTKTINQVREEANRIFKLQQQHQYVVAQTTAKERRQKLTRLLNAVLKNQKLIQEALYKDFRKPVAAVDLIEIYPVVSEIRQVRSNLRKWMTPHRVPTPLALFGSRSSVIYEPKGVVLIIAPWNYPFQLTIGPLITAIAAGNCAILKPSEHTPHTSAILSQLIAETFEEREVAVLEGAVETSTALLDLPFNHIFFTGSPAIGKIVMAAAAKHLTSVTLELGGKSPTVVDDTANLDKAADRIASTKMLNNGQTCIAPDYVLAHESIKEKLIKKIKEKLEELYTTDAQDSPDYERMVNVRHFDRVKSYLDDALAKNATIAYGGQTNEKDRFIGPTVVTDLPDDALLMQEEIFGPVLPILTFQTLEEAVQIIRKKEKPLALYIFSNKEKNIQYLLTNTTAGGSCINHSSIHFLNPELPFGGVNNSGIGKAHGFEGFEAFSNKRAVLRQWSPLSATDLLQPPYNNWKQKIIDLTIKWL